MTHRSTRIRSGRAPSSRTIWCGVATALLLVAAACSPPPSEGPVRDSKEDLGAPVDPTPKDTPPKDTPPKDPPPKDPPPPEEVPPPTSAPTTTVVTDPPAPPPGVPGVTLRDIDGGPDYFGQWSNSFRTDPDFFPIGVWAESFVDDQTTRNRIDAYEAMGVNFFPEPYGMPHGIASYLSSKGMYIVTSGTSPTNAAQKTTDEPDWRGCHPASGNVAAEAPSWAGSCWTIGSATGARDTGPVHPDFLQRWSDGLRDRDPSRPVYGQFTHAPRAGIPGCQEFWNNENTARAYFASADIISFDWYVLTHPWTPANCKHVWYQGEAVANARRLSDHSKPVMPAIGTSYIFENNDYRPTAADVNAEVWNAIIAGARGIQYFNHDFRTGTHRVLLDHRFTDIRAQVTETNARIHALAPVLNAPFAEGLVTLTGGSARVMAKAYDGDYYVFVAPTTRSSQSVTLEFADGDFRTADVLHEDRTVPVTDGRLTDQFADQNTIHIYRLSPGS